MKKNILIITLITIVSLVYISGCTNSESANSLYTPNPELSQKFVNSLSDFNDSYRATIGIHPEKLNGSKVKCEKCWGWLKKTLVVASADIVGAAAGVVLVKEAAALAGAATGGTGAAVVAGTAAVIAGAGASIAAADQLKESKIIELPFEDERIHDDKRIHEDELVANLDIIYPEEFGKLSSVGADHNKLVYQYYSKSGTKSTELAVEQLSLEEKAIFESVEWERKVDEINSLVSNYVKSSDIFELNESLLENGLLTSNTKLVLDKFYEIFLKSQNSHDIKTIVQFYIDAIAHEPSLPKDEKEALISALSVATESPYFWTKMQQ